MYRTKVFGTDGKENARLGAWCPQEVSERGWSLAKLQNQKDVSLQPTLVKGLRCALQKMGVHKGYAPAVSTFSASITDTSEFKRINLGENVSLFRNNVIPADGIFLKTGKAFVMSGAGCPIIIAKSNVGDMIVAHAGRESLIDWNVIVRNEPSRKYSSVVNAIIDALVEHGGTIEKIEMCMQLSIPKMMFDHPYSGPYGSYNTALRDYLRMEWPEMKIPTNGNKLFLSLEELFKAQARRAGVEYVWAENSLDEITAPLTHTRDGTDPNRVLGRRNLIIVKRC